MIRPHRFSIVTTARWETDAIAEWVMYHRSIGFDHVYVYCNDDDPTGLYESLLPFLQGETPYVTFLHFGLLGLQRQMLLHFLARYRHETEWVAFFDVDEFLHLPGRHDIAAFVADSPADADCFYFNWVFFGTSNFDVRPSGPVLPQYTQRQAVLHPFTKTMLRVCHVTDDWIASNPTHNFWHDIGDLLGPINIYNSIGEHCENYYHGFPEAAQAHLAGDRSNAILRTALLHHYTLKSKQDFQRRADRGIKGEFRNHITWQRMLERGETQPFLDATNAVEDRSLADYWANLVGMAHRRTIVPIAPSRNLALGCAALQSSVSQWSSGSTPAEDAALVVNGHISGHNQHHTGLDNRPWWQVDLGAIHPLQQIRVFNRLDNAQERMSHVQIAVSLDGLSWTPVLTKTDEHLVGGADGSPLIWTAAVPTAGRWVRVMLLASTYLHLDQVEVYGDASSG